MTVSETMDSPPEHASLIGVVEHLADKAPDEGLTLKEIIHQLGDRAFGAALFVLALPCAIPFLWGVPQIVSVPMMVLALQMAIGRHEPWLPEKLAQRVMGKEDLTKLSRFARKYFGWAERLSHPRLTFLTGNVMDRVVGVILVVFCASILTPLPGTNTAPGIAVAIVAFGQMEEDGVLISGGIVLGAAWISLLLMGGTTLIKSLLGMI